MMEDGDLLPISLKKAPDQKSVVIKTINFIENDVQIKTLIIKKMTLDIMVTYFHKQKMYLIQKMFILK